MKLQNTLIKNTQKQPTNGTIQAKTTAGVLGLRIKKRAIVNLLHRKGYFKVAFVFEQKAFDTLMASDINTTIKKELTDANVYVEGRGIRIDVKDASVIKEKNN